MTTVNDRSTVPGSQDTPGDADSQEPNAPLTDEEVFGAHEGGKLSIAPTAPLTSPRDLSIAYTPGVADVSRAISGDETLAARYTWTRQLVAVVSDGTAVLGLGDIGPRASLPVMEGKSALFKTFAGLDSIPLVFDTTDVDEIVESLVRMRPSFGAVNLEDVAAPRCFDLERRLIEALDCPVMHDDQHGTAVVTLAALRNACRVVGRELSSLRVVISGAGAAGVACAEILEAAGIGEVIVADSRGVIHAGRDNLTPIKAELAERTNPRGVTGGIAEALQGADALIGVSAGQIPEELIESMADDAIVFALSNPDPEIHPAVAARHASVVATGRSDFPNQINNVLAFPGIFKGALEAGSRMISDRMKVAAAEAIAEVAADELAAEYIVPSPLDPRVAPEVTAAVAKAARQDGVATA
ncbi:malate dehydrogenase (oxaloacetate-decarboxylating) [Haloactinomyces albus]|uniref:Malate dehydrogenase (Oxaloacetate-decarboxylating) n=1 Tax=Haloactinomyces albus TaxID=1352928 RepID=A0AAE3ZDX9_9ACTN|nr:NADP-dependent malic enzyme [Haloactinomyces albus]MDR7301259.1 malate dehydrogenase (oxaloacetate-decarboxylating) [Haloactinomyces albus]